MKIKATQKNASLTFTNDNKFVDNIVINDITCQSFTNEILTALAAKGLVKVDGGIITVSVKFKIEK